MAGVSTTTPGMQAAAGHLGSTQSVAKNGVQTVSGALDTLKSTWTGDASAAFDTSMRAWMDDCTFIVNKLGEMIEVMNGNRQVITAGESSNTETASSIPVGPGLAGL
ncbi:WXG100 family type VII secretion target [Nocardia sp. NRRL S-836]|uniref:WXG100 family type VII secretion target n=1 Tax=Nocardia sp. NRRL S-836 TaxID=1519492 RepID=UPI0009E6B2FB|nr:WXG100 family type VII secretion target [Nocardia sp. NRRL S-836]